MVLVKDGAEKQKHCSQKAALDVQPTSQKTFEKMAVKGHTSDLKAKEAKVVEAAEGAERRLHQAANYSLEDYPGMLTKTKLEACSRSMEKLLISL